VKRSKVGAKAHTVGSEAVELKNICKSRQQKIILSAVPSSLLRYFRSALALRAPDRPTHVTCRPRSPRHRQGLSALGQEDTYRFPIPKDVTGINIMKATLVRLNDYERKNPNQFSDIVQFNKALALERLREYDQAAALYRKVAETDGRLAAEAAKNAEIPRSVFTYFRQSHTRLTILSNTSPVSTRKSQHGTNSFKNIKARNTHFWPESKRSALTAPRSPLSKLTAIVSRKAIS